MEICGLLFVLCVLKCLLWCVCGVKGKFVVYVGFLVVRWYFISILG